MYRKSNLAPALIKYENADKIKSNAQKTHRLNLVLLNKKNGKYHKPTCEYGLMASQIELTRKPFWGNYTPANCCYPCKKSECAANKKELEQSFDIYQSPYEHSVEIIPAIDTKEKAKLKTGLTLLFNSPYPIQHVSVRAFTNELRQSIN